jgi:hypothetical protein
MWNASIEAVVSEPIQKVQRERNTDGESEPENTRISVDSPMVSEGLTVLEEESRSCTTSEALEHATTTTCAVADTVIDLEPPIPNSTFPSYTSDEILHTNANSETFVTDDVLYSHSEFDMMLLSASSEETCAFLKRLPYPLETTIPPDILARQSIEMPTAFIDTYNHWPRYRCNPTSSLFLNDAQTNYYHTLANLQVLENAETWELCIFPTEHLLTDTVVEVSCDTTTRDWLLFVTQHIWRTVKQEARHNMSGEKDDHEEAHSWMEKVILLPPINTMRRLLQRYFEREQTRFYLFPPQRPATCAVMGDKLISGLITLLMIAKVTRTSVAIEGQALSNGMVALCRIFVRDADWTLGLERLEISLSMIQLLQWSGEPSHMNVRLSPALTAGHSE